MKLLDRIPDRLLAFMTAGFFAMLGLDVAIPDALPFIDEAVLATVASTLVATMLGRRKTRRLAREAEAAASAASEAPPS
ncbi:MAG: hypothetical protein KDA24_01000 [Deltaproteobacteria bacterium]|nr:hypothetical protein [Deltaproteobacteria bacterium]